MASTHPDTAPYYMAFVAGLWDDYAAGRMDDALFHQHCTDCPAFNAWRHAMAYRKNEPAPQVGDQRQFWARRGEVFAVFCGEPMHFPEVVFSRDEHETASFRKTALCGAYIAQHRDYFEAMSEHMEAALNNGQTELYVSYCAAVSDLIEARSDAAKFKR